MASTGVQADLLLRLMSAATLRARIIAGNISNQNTPGFKRREVRFEDALMRELGRPGGDPGKIRPEIVVDDDAPMRGDGNTVSPELEVSALRETRLLYELYAGILKGQTDLIRSAIHGDR